MISFDAISASSFHTPRCSPGKIQVIRRSRAQVRRDLPPVHLDHFAVQIEHRDNQRTVEVLVPRLLVAQDAKLFQPRPLRVAGGAVRRRQMQAQRAVGDSPA